MIDLTPKPSPTLRPYIEIMRLRDALRTTVQLADVALRYLESFGNHDDVVLQMRSRLGKLAKELDLKRREVPA